MSKIKIYDRVMYDSIKTGLREVMAPYQFNDIRDGDLTDTYTPIAYEQAAAFLCVNDIQHTFTINPIDSNLRARIVIVSWIEDDGTEDNLVWWEKTDSDCYLVRFEEDWADEMSIYGFAIFTTDEYSNWSHIMFRLCEAMNQAVFTYSFGTNEEQDYEDFEEFLKCFTVKVIPAKHAEILRDMFNINEYYGEFPTVDYLNYCVEGMEAG